MIEETQTEMEMVVFVLDLNLIHTSRPTPSQRASS